MAKESAAGERTYGLLKADLLCGSLDPHSRLDFAELARRYAVSTTPVREAAMRLLGEGLLDHHPKGGIRPLMLLEDDLRFLLDLNLRLMTFASDALTVPVVAMIDEEEDGSSEALTRALFAGLARSMGNPIFSDVVDRLNDRLALVRTVEDQVLDAVRTELAELRHILASGAPIKTRLRGYHKRRLAVAPNLVWLAASRRPAG